MFKFLFLSIIIGVGGFFLMKNNPQLVGSATHWITQITKAIPIQKQTANTKTANHTALAQQPALQKQILGIQQEVTQLKVTDVSTSSPKIQQIIKQLQALPQGSINQIKDSCMQICNRL